MRRVVGVGICGMLRLRTREFRSCDVETENEVDEKRGWRWRRRIIGWVALHGDRGPWCGGEGCSGEHGL